MLVSFDSGQSFLSIVCITKIKSLLTVSWALSKAPFCVRVSVSYEDISVFVEHLILDFWRFPFEPFVCIHRVGTLKCCFTDSGVLNTEPHCCGHGNFFPEWIISCLLKLFCWLKDLPQTRHLKFMSAPFFSCIRNLWACGKTKKCIESELRTDNQAYIDTRTYWQTEMKL